ncbi:hypothetical protein [Salinimicrobium sediminis]|nr:hypothetical protein [Salinimicrobium sediminis]
MADKQMLHLIEILKSSGRIRFGTEFCEAVGLLKQNLYKIQKGEKHFTPDHIEKAVKEYKVNANWIFGVSDKIFLPMETAADTK